MRSRDDDAEQVAEDARIAHARVRRVLGPLAELLEEKPPATEGRLVPIGTVQNITVTSRGTVFVERLGKADEKLPIVMSVDQRRAIITQLANRSGGRTVNTDRSTLEADLPAPYRGRVQAVVEPIAPAPWFTLRVPLPFALPIEDYVDQQTLRAWWAYGIEAAVRLEKSGFVIGNVNSGKTTLQNSVMELKSRYHGHYRPIGVQDRDELILDSFEQYDIITFGVGQADFQGDRYHRYTYTPQDALATALRAKGNFIVWSEVRDQFSALGLGMSQNTGQRGLWGTLHCDGPDDAPGRWEDLLGLAIGGPVPGRLIANITDAYVFIERDPERGERKVISFAAQRKSDEKPGYVIVPFPGEPPAYRVDVARIGDRYAIRVPALPEIEARGEADDFATVQDALDAVDDVVQRVAAIRWWKEDLPASDVQSDAESVRVIA